MFLICFRTLTSAVVLGHLLPPIKLKADFIFFSAVVYMLIEGRTSHNDVRVEFTGCGDIIKKPH